MNLEAKNSINSTFEHTALYLAAGGATPWKQSALFSSWGVVSCGDKRNDKNLQKYVGLKDRPLYDVHARLLYLVSERTKPTFYLLYTISVLFAPILCGRTTSTYQKVRPSTGYF